MEKNPSPELIGKVVERFSALADETRIRLLLRLKQGESNVTRLSEELDVGQASVSKHLSVLRQTGLVEVRREGTQAIYRVRDETIFNLCSLVCDGVVRFLEQEHATLKLRAARRPARRSPARARTRG